MLERQPTLLRWEVEAAKDGLLAAPEVGTYLSDVHRLTAQAERLPADVAAERKAIVAAADRHIHAVDGTVAAIRSGFREGEDLAASVDPAGRSLDAMLTSVDTVMQRYDSPVASPAAGSPSAAPARAFDMREYTTGVKVRASGGFGTQASRDKYDRLTGGRIARVVPLTRNFSPAAQPSSF